MASQLQKQAVYQNQDYFENWQLRKLMKDNVVAAPNQINMDNMRNIPPTQGAVPDIRGFFHLW